MLKTKTKELFFASAFTYRIPINTLNIDVKFANYNYIC